MRLKGQGSIRKRQNGGWGIRYSVRGTVFEESVGTLLGKPPALTTEADAQRALAARIREIGAGRFVGPKVERTTIGEVLDAYLADLRLRGSKSVRSASSNVTAVRDAFGDQRAVDLTRARIRDWMEELLDEGELARGTVNNHVLYLLAALRLAKKEGAVLEVPSVPLLSVRNARQGFFEREEYDRVMAGLPAWLQAPVAFAYTTGWRRSEVLGLRWAYVDRATGVIRLPDSKNGHGRVIPLQHGVGALIDAQDARRREEERLSPWVFPREDGTPIVEFRQRWDRACAAAGCPERLFHDLRRTACRDMIAAGLDYATAMSISGHRTMSIYLRYQISSTTVQARGLGQLAAYRAGGRG